MNKFNPEMQIDGPLTPTNGDRADRAERAVIAYWGDDGSEDIGIKIQDLLCDLMHLANREHVEFEAVLANAVNAQSSFDDESGND